VPTTYGNLNKTSSADPNILKLQETTRVRPLDNVVADWRQHAIQHPTDPEQFASVVCPGPRSCPLCRKPADVDGEQRFPISRRYATNVWDYASSSVKVLIAGPQVFGELDAAHKVGIEPATCDWTIVKEGTKRMTKYRMIRHDAGALPVQVTPDQLLDVAKYEVPATTQEIFDALERFGIDYDSLQAPSFSYDEALAFEMPYTSYKGQTLEQMFEDDDARGFAVWLHGQKLEQGQLGDPVFLAFQAVMEERGMAPPLEEQLQNLPEPPETGQPVQNPRPAGPVPVGRTVQPVHVQQSPATQSLVHLISPEGLEVHVPATVADLMRQQGFKDPAPEPPPAAPSVVKVQVGDQVLELDSNAAAALVTAGAGTLVDEAPEPEPEPPKLPLPDEPVGLEIGGATVQMPFVQAAQLVDQGHGVFADVSLTELYRIHNERAAAQPDPMQTGQSATASTPAADSESPSTSSSPASESPGADPNKPFKCQHCEAAYKTKGGLTQHMNKVHEPQPAAVSAPAASAQENGAPMGVLERVKDKVARAPFARDYSKLIGIFHTETGKRNILEMDEAELVKLEKRLDQELTTQT